MATYLGDAGVGSARDERDRCGALFSGEEDDVKGGAGEAASCVEVGGV